jgi:hypothetical protein
MTSSRKLLLTVLPLRQLNNLGQLAREQEVWSLSPIAHKFLTEGFKNFCGSIKPVIDEMRDSNGKRPDLDTIWKVISNGSNCASSAERNHDHIFHFSVYYMRKLNSIASEIPDIRLSTLVRWFFRLEFDAFYERDKSS